ncbi:hypothetical protein D3C87_330760 [compost metagenome]
MKNKLLLLLLFLSNYGFSQGFSGFKFEPAEIQGFISNNSSKKTYFFPNAIKTSELFKILYDDNGHTKFVGQTGFILGDKTGSIYSEIVGGTFLKVLRLSLGTMISNSNSEEQKTDEAYQRLITYGGNTVLNIEYPWLFYRDEGFKINLLSRFILKGTADIPAFGTKTDDWAGSGSLGISFYIDAGIDSDDLKLFVDNNTNYIVGTNIFRDNLGIKNSNFLFSQLTLGLVYKQSFKISFVVGNFSSEPLLRNKNVSVGGQVIR